ncbi:hypothetical protein MJE76_31190 [Bacillus cereus]
MNMKKAVLRVLTISSLCALTGCDNTEKVNAIDEFTKQQALQQGQI